MSVFDIKEHSDLKFRPGAVVVRVGGFQVRIVVVLVAYLLLIFSGLSLKNSLG